MKLVDLFLILMNEVDLRGCQMSNLFSYYVKICLPRGEEGVQLVPVLSGEGPVHGGRHVHHLVGLVDFGAYQLGLQNWKKKEIKIDILTNFLVHKWIWTK